MKNLLNILFWSVISAAFIGPGTVATCVKAGATHQSQLIWALVFATVSCIILQEAAARISIASGKNLGQAIAERFDWGGKEKWLIRGLFIAVAVGCAAYESGNILGAVAGLQLVKLISATKITLGILICATFLLWSGNFKLIANLLGGVVALMGLTFIGLAFQLEIDWGTVASNMVLPTIPASADALVIGLIGTTIVPYNIFLGSGLGKGQSIREMRFGLSIAILLGGLISMGILLVGTQLQGDVSFENLAVTLEKLAGSNGRLLLGIGLFAAGLTSAITAPFAAAITAQALFGEKKWANNTSNFRMVWLGVLIFGGIFGFSQVKPITVIIAAQALNGFLLPIITFLLVMIVNDKQLLHQYCNRKLANIAMLLVLGISSFLGLKSVLAAVYGVIGISLVMTTPIILALTGLSLLIVGGTIWRVLKNK